MFDFLEQLDSKMLVKIGIAILVLLCLISTFSVGSASRRSKTAVISTLKTNSNLKKQIKLIAKVEARKEAKKEATKVVRKEVKKELEPYVD